MSRPQEFFPGPRDLKQRAVIQFLKNNGIEFVRRKSFNWCRNPLTGCKLLYSFYLPELNILISCHGWHVCSFEAYAQLTHYHARQPDKKKEIADRKDFKLQQFRESTKFMLAKENGMSHIVIPCKTGLNVKKFLENKLSSFLTSA